MVSISRYFIWFAGIIVLQASCKVNTYKNGVRSGGWVFRDTIDGVVIKNKGKFKNGVECKTWKYFQNTQLVKKEKYTDSIADVWEYHANGKIKFHGKTTITLHSKNKIIHWFYNGEWRKYNESGKLILVQMYDTGQLVTETPIQ